MLDRTIPFYNTILKCSAYTPQEVRLPDGFSIVPYREGYEKEWARMEYAIEDFDSYEEAEQYFISTYMSDPRALLENTRFLLDPDNRVIGSCIAWQDPRQDGLVPSLHWLIVDETYHAMGLGRALTVAVMNIFHSQNRLPVYIHTQPWSWKAVCLYHSLGFQFQKTDTFSHYVNQHDLAMAEIRKHVPEETFAKFLEASEP